MKKVVQIFLQLFLSISLIAQSDLTICTTKISGEQIIRNRFRTSFSKIDLDKEIFIYDSVFFSSPNYFQLKLIDINSSELSIYGLGIIKDTICFFIVDSNNDHNFINDKTLEIPVNRDNNNPVIIKCDYNEGYTWLKLLSAKTDNNNNLSEIEHKIYEYRMVEIQENDKTYKIRIEPTIGLNYSYPNILLEENDNANKLRIGEYLQIANSIYLIKNSNKIGDTITFKKILEKRFLTSTQKGYKAHEIIGESINGDNISLNHYKGKYVLLDFWDTGCGACIMEMKHYMKDIYDLYGGDRFEILGINVRDNKEMLKKFIDKNGYTWPQLMSPLKGKYVSDYNIFYFPTYYLIDTSGIILENDLWGIPNLPNILNRLLPDEYLTEKLLSKQIKFNCKESLDAKYPLLYLMTIDGNKNSYALYKKDNTWQYSLDLSKGEYLYYFYFDGLTFIDTNNPNWRILEGQKYSVLTVKE